MAWEEGYSLAAEDYAAAMRNHGDEYIHFDNVTILKQTQRALLLEIPIDPFISLTVWVPRACLDNYSIHAISAAFLRRAHRKIKEKLAIEE